MNSLDYINSLEKTLDFSYYEDICLYNSNKVLEAFRKENISEIHFSSTTGYGYGDIGRERIKRGDFVLGALLIAIGVGAYLISQDNNLGLYSIYVFGMAMFVSAFIKIQDMFNSSAAGKKRFEHCEDRELYYPDTGLIISSLFEKIL